MKEAAQKTEGGEPAVKAPKRGRMKLIAIIGVLVVAGGAAAGGFFFWRSRTAAAEAAGHEVEKGSKPKVEEEAGMLEFEPFVVNLADQQGTRFLRASLRLLVNDADRAAELQEDKVKITQVRSAILELLSTQLADNVVTPQGKEALKKMIVERASRILGEVQVRDVLFAEFVVQF
jgi:flagellar FliL protein